MLPLLNRSNAGYSWSLIPHWFGQRFSFFNPHPSVYLHYHREKDIIQGEEVQCREISIGFGLIG